MKPSKPCPHCGSKKADTEHDWRSYYVACPRCNAQGPKAKTEADSIRLWDEGVKVIVCEILNKYADILDGKASTK